ncbi:FAD-binding protein [Actinoplanes derwentensis]|uniref:3-oxo-5alpha-steroid 4-dehydrogenase n=1 Tax=Actinoplanes derwentensis TaxID=113562 RepID=A0A1H2B2C3_9ACTN|nr:FAD-binding protein [Actinoplanes derwentensis]GID87570.1 putative dehydrogenase [Actinoplanes derwentensis]SDT52430.1 3-oxo-5alpha-steroid 4-dehydrogenase [Actinoplanes derwentensis]
MDVVVVGFGAAGACAAIEAAASGASVLVVDRFGGGGATAISGGVVYAGGGTRQQRSAAITDTPIAMYEYLHREVQGAVSDRTLRRFCDESPAMLAWLEEQGVPFDASLCPDKTSYPSNRHYLYQSGNEHLHPGPAPRGHRVFARGTSGGTLHARLAASVRAASTPAAGAQVLLRTRAVSLVVDASGRVGGVRCRTLRAAPFWARFAFDRLHRWSVKPGVYVPRLGRALHRMVGWIENRYGRDLVIPADAVVLAAGGFVFDREMMREHAPRYRGLRLGTPGDDGSGIRLGTAAGAGVRHLDRVTLWRFLTPPSALLGGLLVDRDGRRICDESLYGAAIGERILDRPGGRAWLLVDAAVLAEARRRLRAQTLWFQRLQVRWLLAHRISAPTVAEAARRAGIDPAGLAETVAAHTRPEAATDSAAFLAGSEAAIDSAVSSAGPDAATDSAASSVGPDGTSTPASSAGANGVPGRGLKVLGRAPFSLLDVSLRALPAPMLTLGGLTVDEDTGGVLRPDGTVIEGLYAAGRTAVGVCSGSYVSGLSLADCVFSGRRAGRHAATPAPAHVAGPDGAIRDREGEGCA